MSSPAKTHTLLVSDQHRHPMVQFERNCAFTGAIKCLAVWSLLMSFQIGKTHKRIALVEVSRSAQKWLEVRHPVPLREHGVFEPCTKVEGNNTATNLLLSAKLGWDQGPPEWVRELCPQIVKHLDTFPFFKAFPIKNGTSLPVTTTDYASVMLCTLSAVQNISRHLNIPLHLHAGSHLGAARHGQPIPWDDDIDVAIPLANVTRFSDQCEGRRIHPTAVLKCAIGYKCLKVYVEYSDMGKQTLPRGIFKWKAPFIDLFTYKVNTMTQKVALVMPQGNNRQLRKNLFPFRDFFPLQPRYFGGLSLLSPPLGLAEKRYSLSQCFLGSYHHRYEERYDWEGKFDTLEIDCCKLSSRFPFMYGNFSFISDGHSQVNFK